MLQAFAAEADAFGGAELALMDIAVAELAVVHRLGTQLLERSGLHVSATTDRLRALDGAEYVLTTFREGGLEARHLDEHVPLAFGLVGQETIGPGGFFFAMRTVQVMRATCGELERWSPAATLVNYTNPTQIVAEAVTRYTPVRCLAICDQTDDDRAHLAAALGLPPAAVELESVGLNHATWSTHCRIEGGDGVARLIAAGDDVLASDGVSPPVKRQVALTRAFGHVPNGYLQNYYEREATVDEAQAAPRTRAQVIASELPGTTATSRSRPQCRSRASPKGVAARSSATSRYGSCGRWSRANQPGSPSTCAATTCSPTSTPSASWRSPTTSAQAASRPSHSRASHAQP